MLDGVQRRLLEKMAELVSGLTASELAILFMTDDEFDDDDSEEEEVLAVLSRIVAQRRLTGERNAPAHIESYVEKTVPQYSSVQFREHFRMSRSAFEELLQWMAPHMPKQHTITLQKSVLATLWYIGNTETFRSVSDRFGLRKSSLRQKVMRVSKVLVEHQKDWIKWPNSQAEMEQMAHDFEARCHFPGVVGAIDGTHIEIPGPSEFRDSYINRKGFPSIQLQVIANKKLLFLDAFTGYPGSAQDADVYNNSPVAEKLLAGGLPPRFHLLGDSAYPLHNFLIVPFRNDAPLRDVEKNFNRCHSSTRVEVERAIGLLKGKWRKLKFLEMRNLSDMLHVIVAACVLHNFVIIKHGVDDDEIEDPSNDEEDLPNHGNPNQRAIDKRMEIAYALH